MRQIFILAAGIIWALAVQAQDLSIVHIPAPLLENANAIMRDHKLEITIKNPGQAVVKETEVYTILNERGARYANFNGYYDQIISISDIEGKLMDANGRELKKVKKKDISDLSNETGITVTDTRYKVHSFGHTQYPYTVSYSYEHEINGLFNLPGWRPQPGPDVAVQKSNISIKVPPGYQLRYKLYNLPRQDLDAANGQYSLTIENVKAVKTEPMMPDWPVIMPFCMVAPSEFEIKGYKGRMDSWQTFGAFIHKLTEGRDALPPDMAQKVKAMVQGVQDPYKKIEILYNFLQENNRYISVQLGIGGWQTIPAAQVARTGYGDCKALSNYMGAMLREVGIDSKYTFIRNGDEGRPADIDFVANQFNHAILCVPLGKDTLWLECTSNTFAPGYIGGGNYNRHALLIDENGGTMVPTPSYPAAHNRQIRTVQGQLLDNGDIQLKAKTIYTGRQQEVLRDIQTSYSADKVIQFLRRRFDMPTYDVHQHAYHFQRSRVPELHEELELTTTRYAQISGKRLFIVPNLLSKSGIKLNMDTARKFDIVLDYPYIDTDSSLITVPDGYEVESQPQPVEVSSPFGTYTAKYLFQNNQVVFIREFSQIAGTYPARMYPELVTYLQAIHKYDRQRVVLRKKDTVLP